MPLTVEQYAAELAERFEAMSELDRVRERDARAGGMPHLAAVHAVYAHANMQAAKMLREDIKRRARCGRRAA